MRTTKIIATVLLAAMCLPLSAQSEAGLLVSAKAEKQVNKKLSFGIEAEMCTRNNLKTMDRWKFGIGAEYKLTSWLKANAGYNLLNQNYREDYNYKSSGALNKWRPSYWGIKHRVYASLTGSYKFSNNIKLSLRERWQYTYRPEQADKRMDYQHASLGYSYPVKGKATNVWRNKLQLKYKTDGLLQPYLFGETYVGGSGFEKLRLSVGTELKLSKKSSLNVGYVYQRPYGDDEDNATRHILNIGYKLKF